MTSVILVTLATIGLLNVAQANEASCLEHFTSEGNKFSGRMYTTWLEFPNVKKAAAYTKIYASVAKDGWTIVSSDKDAGILSASQQVSYGRGATNPLVVVVEDSGRGSKATVTFRLGGGQSASLNTIKKKLCEYIGAAN